MAKAKQRASLISMIAIAAACVAAPALIAVAAPAPQQPAATQTDTLIHAGRLLADPASGRVLTQQTILVRDGKIVSITAGYTTARSGQKVVDLKSSFVLPGLIDSHVHITGEQGPNSRLDSLTSTSADDAITGAGFGMKTLLAGFTTVADLGAETNAIMALRKGIARGTIAGPRIIAAGPAVSVHGGHGDIEVMPHLLGVSRVRPERTCDTAHAGASLCTDYDLTQRRGAPVSWRP